MVRLSTQAGTYLFSAEGNLAMDLYPIKEENRITSSLLLVASRYRTGNEHEPDGPLGLNADFFPLS